MPPTSEDIELARAHEPILLFHPDESYAPIDAKRWFETAALWSAAAPFADKAKWGLPTGPDQPFPRLPLIKAGAIALSDAETQPGQVDVTSAPHNYLFTESGMRELFLEVDGWDDSDAVTDTSSNATADLAAVKLRTMGDEFAPFRDRYAVEIVEAGALENLLAFSYEQDFLGLVFDLFEAPKLVLYYFLYPGHEEELLGCQVVESKVRDANFSGDWGCVAIFFDGDQPKWIGHSVHNAGAIEEPVKGLRIGMLIDEWSRARKEAGHPYLYVASGTHGQYLTPGDKQRPSFSPLGTDVSRTACGAVEDVYEAVRSAAEAANHLAQVAETAKDAIVVLAKILGAAALGGPIVGLIVGLCEAFASDAPKLDVPPPLPANDPVDELPEQAADMTVAIGRAIRPAGVVIAPDLHATEVVDWNVADIAHEGRTYPTVVDREAQAWWPPTVGAESSGYEGRWGPRVQHDPRDRRCGMVFPDFRELFFRELFITLSR